MISTENNPRGRSLVIAIVLYALVVCAIAIRSRPPASKSENAPAIEFSGARARSLLQTLVGDGVPHPVGSEQNAIVRGRVVSQLKLLGYQPRIQSDFACSPYGECAEVENVVARLDGREPGPSVMLSAHYDSVPAGPGASDDGASVAAVLEIARALKVSAAPRHPVIFLIDDGEEAGLLGAEAFVSGDPWARDVRADVNMEARGTSGPSAMFETGSANLWLMRMYAAAVHSPHTSSISYAVYKLLPNDTDFTVFKRAGYQGFNFAFIGDVAHYHTPLDNFANASTRSIQHQGASALAALRALANSDLGGNGHSEAVFFDLLNWKTVWWPAQWSAGFAAFALVLLIIEAVFLMRRRFMQRKSILLGLASWPLALIVDGLLGVALSFLLRAAGALPANWVAHPSPVVSAFWALGFLVTAVLGLAFWSAAGFWGLWSGVWICWGVAGIILAFAAPAFSYVFVVPALAAGIFGLALVVARDKRSGSAVAAIVPAAIAATIVIEVIWFLYDAMGGIALAPIGVLVALVSTPLAPLFGTLSGKRRWIFPGAALAVVILGAASSLLAPAFSANWPEALNLDYYQDADTGKSYWIANPSSGRLPRSLSKVADFAKVKLSIYPWNTNGALASEAPQLNLFSPQLTIRQSSSFRGMRHYDVLVRSPRGAPFVAIAFPSDSGVESFSMQGHVISETSQRLLRYTHGWRWYSCATTPPQGIAMAFTLPVSKSVQVYLLDETFGLPPQAARLRAARPSDAVPIQNGDATIVSRHLMVGPQ